MTDNEKAAQAIGYLKGFGAIVWMLVGEKLTDEYADGFYKAVEVLRKVIFDEVRNG